jgi:hypothetical protein
MDIISALFLLVAVFIFICIFYGPWQGLCIDWARQSMFEARDQIFDAAAAGLIAFDSNEYKTLRCSIERMIRFCHEISWPRLVLFYVLFDKTESTELRDAVDGLQSDKAKEISLRAMRKVARAILLCLTCRSIFLVAPFFIARCAHYMNEGLLMAIYNLVERDAESFAHYASVRRAKAA